MSNKTAQNGKGSNRRSKENTAAISKNWPRSMMSAFDLRLEAELKTAKANSKPAR